MTYAKESITLIICVNIHLLKFIYVLQSKSGLTMAINMVSMIFDKITITAKINFFNIYIIDNLVYDLTRYIYSIT